MWRQISNSDLTSVMITQETNRRIKIFGSALVFAIAAIAALSAVLALLPNGDKIPLINKFALLPSEALYSILTLSLLITVAAVWYFQRTLSSEISAPPLETDSSVRRNHIVGTLTEKKLRELQGEENYQEWINSIDETLHKGFYYPTTTQSIDENHYIEWSAVIVAVKEEEAPPKLEYYWGNDQKGLQKCRENHELRGYLDLSKVLPIARKKIQQKEPKCGECIVASFLFNKTPVYLVQSIDHPFDYTADPPLCFRTKYERDKKVVEYIKMGFRDRTLCIPSAEAEEKLGDQPQFRELTVGPKEFQTYNFKDIFPPIYGLITAWEGTTKRAFYFDSSKNRKHFINKYCAEYSNRTPNPKYKDKEAGLLHRKYVETTLLSEEQKEQIKSLSFEFYKEDKGIYATLNITTPSQTKIFTWLYRQCSLYSRSRILHFETEEARTTYIKKVTTDGGILSLWWSSNPRKCEPTSECLKSSS